jgi:hypothetical protein
VFGKAGKQRLRWVSELINKPSNSWDENTIRSLFHPPDADEIMKICQSPNQHDDCNPWAHENNGVFSVRSAYRLGMQIQELENQCSSSSNPDGERHMWNLIWKANVPPKLKVFCWKLATNSLGVQTHRCSRNMDMLPTCTVCGMEPEDAYHVVMNCTKAYALRQHVRKSWSLPHEDQLGKTGSDWVLLLLNQCDEVTRPKLIFIWWRAWHLRNNSIFGDGKCGIQQSANFIVSYLENFTHGKPRFLPYDDKGKAVVTDSGKSTINKIPPKPWTPPRRDWLKLNVDAIFIQDRNEGSWGATLRNHRGEIVASAWGVLKNCPNALMAEGLAALNGIRNTMAFANAHTIIECDNASVINELASQDNSRSELSFIIKDAKNLLRWFPGFTVKKVHRSGNSAAHELAKYARNMNCDSTSCNSVPSCVLDIVLAECNSACNSNSIV